MPPPERAGVAAIGLRLILLLAGLSVGLLLAEGLARVLGPPLPGFVLDATLTAYEPRLYTRHPTRITTLAPSVDVTLQAIEYSTRVRTDRLGLRGAPPADGDLRIAFVGDSFTLGVQVDEAGTFVERAARSVSTATGRRAVGLNAGVDGYGVAQAVDRLEELLRFTRLTHAVLTVYMGNDLRDDTRLDDKRAAMSRPPPPGAEAGFDSLDDMRRKSGWARMSRLYAWTQVVRALRAQAADFRIQEYADELAVFVDPAARRTQLDATTTALQAFGRVCQQRRLQCTVALAPPAWVVHAERRSGTFDAFGLDADAADPAALVADLTAAVPPTVQVVDLTPDLQAAGRDRALYHTFDPHWNSDGHAVVAETLAGVLGRGRGVPAHR